MMVGIDSMILVYANAVPRKSAGVPGPDASQQQDLTLRAKLLLHLLRNDVIVVPTIVVAEILIPVAAERRGEVIAKLRERFVCPVFDLAASEIAADLFVRNKDLQADVQYQTADRNVLKADSMILASAYVAGARDFYTNDKRCRALANLIMTGHPLPTKDHSDMFAVQDILDGTL